MVKKNLPLGEEVSMFSDREWKVIPFWFIFSIEERVSIVLREKRLRE
jgi:hypothetical protein